MTNVRCNSFGTVAAIFDRARRVECEITFSTEAASFTVTAGGVNQVAAEATAHGSELTRIAGTGTVAIEGSFALEGQLVIDISGLPSYDGSIPGIENTQIAFSGSTPFDPFAIDSVVAARADIPPTQHPGIPVPGGIPGQLVLDVAEGSFVDVAFTGSCAGTDGDASSFAGTTTRGGTLVIKPVMRSTSLSWERSPLRSPRSRSISRSARHRS